MKVGPGHNPGKSAKSARIQGVWWTSGSHVQSYTPLPVSTKLSEYKRFRSICVKHNFSSYPKKGEAILFAQHRQILTVKSRVRPSSGKYLADSKGVHGDVESEGSSRQISGPTNRNHIEGAMQGYMSSINGSVRTVV
ncbi:hypothetical protein PCORN_10957 [Listeria cornellensis FSL F6-0969]|uniref:Uncharacterized protein n=1 Tax=Listeria cornellensis FSL F6-0969 TaxID=1265820 RepID=W7CAA7_9LIST|nr:hypothetical protein PCORN_10957 [Listeria cornellensis FSL F6-0969]